MTTRSSAVWAVLIAATAARLAVAALFPLVDDETYYWAWAQRLAWGYPDHPPAIAALIRATTTLLGDGPLGVRAGPVLLSLGNAWLLYDLGHRMFSAGVGALAALWYQTIPLVSVGTILAVPDAPFIFCWLLTIWALWRARGQRGIIWWLAAGAALGLAALSKVTAVFLGISLVGYLAWGEQDRRWWERPEPYAAVAIALALTLPMLRWNSAHGGILLEKARTPIAWIATPFPLFSALAYASAQLAYYGPLSAVLLTAALIVSWRNPRATDPRYVYALWAAIPIMGIFALASFDGIPKPHWPAPGYLVALIPAAALWIARRDRPWWRRTVAVAVAANVLLVGLLTALALWPAGPTAAQLRAWDQVGDRLAQLIEATPSSPGRFILVPDYQTAGQVEYHVRGHVVVTAHGGDAYALWVPHERLLDWNAVYLTDKASPPGLPLARMFRRIELLPPITVAVPGQATRTFVVYRGFGFRGFPAPAARPL